MRLIHDLKWSPSEVENFRHQIFNNLTFGLKAVYDAMEDFDLQVSEENQVTILSSSNRQPLMVHSNIFIIFCLQSTSGMGKLTRRNITNP